MNLKARISLAFALLFLVSLPLIGATRAQLHLSHEHTLNADTHPPLYLPDQHYVRLITLGFDSFASDLLWFTTINYFGKEYRGNRDYRWLNQMCNLVVDLDPNAIHAYEFCASMLTWEAKAIPESNQILSKGITAHPEEWRLWYMRAFNAWYFAEDLPKARADMEQAAASPNAPEFLASLASRLMVETAAPETAISFLSDMVKRATDARAREALSDKLKRAYLARDLAFLREAVNRYEARYNHPPKNINELVTGGIITKLPTEPFGGSYQLNADGNNVETSSNEKPLTFHGKTAKTGIAHEEYSTQ